MADKVLTKSEFASRLMRGEFPELESYARQGSSEEEFQDWYKDRAKKQNLNENPDDPLHQYDYRKAYKAGVEPDEKGHWPSQFKDELHPNRFVNGEDTKTGKTVFDRSQPVDSKPINKLDPMASVFDSPQVTRPNPDPIYNVFGQSGKPTPDLDTLRNALKQHKEGGGSTLEPQTGMPARGRYMLSPHPDREQKLDQPPTLDAIRQFIQANSDLMSKPGKSLGTWHNPEDDKHYLDVSVAESDKSKALDMAKKSKQKAIYDSQEGKDIEVDDDILEKISKFLKLTRTTR